MAKPIQFIKDVKNELQKVVWPSRQQTIKITIQVVVISLLVAAFLGLIDFGLNKLIEEVILP